MSQVWGNGIMKQTQSVAGKEGEKKNKEEMRQIEYK